MDPFQLVRLLTSAATALNRSPFLSAEFIPREQKRRALSSAPVLPNLVPNYGVGVTGKTRVL